MSSKIWFSPYIRMHGQQHVVLIGEDGPFLVSYIHEPPDYRLSPIAMESLLLWLFSKLEEGWPIEAIDQRGWIDMYN